MGIIVVEFEGFDHNSHQCSCKEHTKCIFESEWKVFMGFVIMLLEMCEVMKNVTHNEFVEEDDSE